MPLITIVTGLLSIVLGVACAIAAHAKGHSAPTALIPAYVGIVFVILGAVGFKPSLRPHVMHAAAALALLLTFACFLMGAPKLIQHLMGNLPATTPVRPLAWWSQVGLAAILGAFEVLCVRSFIVAAKARRAAAVAS